MARKLLKIKKSEKKEVIALLLHFFLAIFCLCRAMGHFSFFRPRCPTFECRPILDSYIRVRLTRKSESRGASRRSSQQISSFWPGITLRIRILQFASSGMPLPWASSRMTAPAFQLRLRGTCPIPAGASAGRKSRVLPRKFTSFGSVAGALLIGVIAWVRRGCQASQRGWPPRKSGELPGKSRKLPRNFWIALKIHSERTFGKAAGVCSREVRRTSGELPGKSGSFPEARGSLTPSQRLAKFLSKLDLCVFEPENPSDLPRREFRTRFAGSFPGNSVQHFEAKRVSVPASFPELLANLIFFDLFCRKNHRSQNDSKKLFTKILEAVACN